MPREKQCLICNGLGRKRCISCSGTGYVNKGHYTYDADGRSVYREIHELHVECGGTGQALCYRCGGTLIDAAFNSLEHAVRSLFPDEDCKTW